jgi:hypothetical protein
MVPYYETLGLLFSRIHVILAKSRPPHPFMQRLYEYEYQGGEAEEYTTKRKYELTRPVEVYVTKKTYNEQPQRKVEKKPPPPPPQQQKTRQQEYVEDETYEEQQQYVAPPPLRQTHNTKQMAKSQEVTTTTTTTRYVEDAPPVRNSYHYEPRRAPEPSKEPQVVRNQIHHYDSYDQIPSKNSTTSDSMRMPARSYQPRFYEKTEAFQVKAAQNREKRLREVNNPEYYEQPDYINRGPYNSRDKPKWKI